MVSALMSFPLLSRCAYVAVCVFGSILAINGTIEFGVIFSFILYVRLFTSPLTQMAQGLTNMQTASASAHRIFDFLESEKMPDESEKTTVLTLPSFSILYKYRSVIPTRSVSSSTVKSDLSRAALMISLGVFLRGV